MRVRPKSANPLDSPLTTDAFYSLVFLTLQREDFTQLAYVKKLRKLICHHVNTASRRKHPKNHRLPPPRL